MIQRYKIFELIEQINTNQGPVYSICIKDDNFDKFYVKYINKDNHYDCLAYEILLKRLGDYFGLSTPEIALIDVPDDVFTDAEVNNPHFYGGIVGFGSKDLSESVLLVDEQEIYNKHDFNRYSNPIDIIKVLLLDLHCDNRDRNDGNFNILVGTEDYELYIFDHYDCFGGISKTGKIDPSSDFHLPGTIFRSNIFRSFCKWLGIEEIKNCVNNYIELANNKGEIITVIENCIEDLPGEWQTTDNLEDRLKVYLTDSDRIERLNFVYSEIVRLKQKQL